MTEPRSKKDGVIHPRTWPAKSIAYFVGKGYEKWGPESLNGGIGGSEEAVIKLSRELAKQGWNITVFCERDNVVEDIVEGNKLSVKYVPWQTINIHDTFDVFISSRHPGSIRYVKARLLIADLHDAIEEKHLLSVLDKADFYVVRSQWHRSLYPNIPDDKIKVIGNGIDMREFKDAASTKKRPHSAGYFSSYDRGLELLLELWPSIREQVPDATLDIYYGWNVFDFIYGGNSLGDKFKTTVSSMIKDLSILGVTEHGRIGQPELARHMMKTAVWLYPTEFPETYCITALKTAAARMHQVTTTVAALPEVAVNATFVRAEDIYSNSRAQKQYVEEAVKALLNSTPSEINKNSTWHVQARKWNSLLE